MENGYGYGSCLAQTQPQRAHCSDRPLGIPWCHGINCFKLQESFHLMLLSQLINITSIFPSQPFLTLFQLQKGSCFVPPLLWAGWWAQRSPHGTVVPGQGQSPSAGTCGLGMDLGGCCRCPVMSGPDSAGQLCHVPQSSKSLTGVRRTKISLKSRNLGNSTQLSIIRANFALFLML